MAKKLIFTVLALLVLVYHLPKIWRLRKAFHSSAISAPQILKQAKEKRNEDKEFIKREKTLGRSFTQIIRDLQAHDLEEAQQKQSWLKMVCSRTAERQLDDRTVFGRIDSRTGAIFLTEKVQSWDGLLKKQKLQSDMTLVWLQNILFDVASIDALSNPSAKISPQAVHSLRTYSKYLHDLSNKAKGPSWLSSGDEWLKVYDNPKALIMEIRGYWLQVKNGTCP